MKIVHISNTSMAYSPARFVDLINKYTKHRADLIQAKTFFTENPLNISTNCNNRHIIVDLIKEADILHFHGTLNYDTKKIKGVKFGHLLKGKKIFLHYHGTPQRESPNKFKRSETTIVSTPEMKPLFKDSIFFPNLIDETSNLYTKKQSKSDKIKICHHYSLHKQLKNTDFFEKMINKSKIVDFEIINQCNLKEAIEKRSCYDCVFDHFQGYYGMISIEAMAQKIAVINGCSDYVLSELEEFFGEKPPFLVLNKEKFLKFITTSSKEYFNEIGKLGEKFMVEKWSGKKNIHRLIELYEKS